MRLATLDPKLTSTGDGTAILEFACPMHGVGHMEHAQLEADPSFEGWPDVVRLPIATPLGGPPRAHTWNWNGETDVEKLTITPSVHYFGHWHGHVTDGEVTTANG